MADHDSGYKLLFSHPQMIVELLRGFLRESWVQTLDFSTLERVSGSFVSGDLRERHSDMIWRVRWSGPGAVWFYVYLLVEFQSTPDLFMAVRLLGYVALSWPTSSAPAPPPPPRSSPPCCPSSSTTESARGTRLSTSRASSNPRLPEPSASCRSSPTS